MAKAQGDGWEHYTKLRPWDDNPAVHPEFQPEAIAESIRAFGFVAPVIIWPSKDRLVAGHGRLQAMRLIVETGYAYLDAHGQVQKRGPEPGFRAKGSPGPGMVRVVRHEFESEAAADAYGLADNELARSATWDDARVQALVKRLNADESFEALHAIGFDPDALGRMVEEGKSGLGFLAQFADKGGGAPPAPGATRQGGGASSEDFSEAPGGGQATTGGNRETLVDFVAPVSVAERAYMHGVINLAKRVTGLPTTREALGAIMRHYEAHNVNAPEATP